MEKARLDIKIDKKLKADIKEYVRNKGTTMTQITIDNFKRLLAQEAEEPPVEPL